MMMIDKTILKSQTKTTIMKEDKYVPRLALTSSGRIYEIERFSRYVVRQIGFTDVNECSRICKLVEDYLKKTKGCEDNIYAMFSSESNAEALHVKFMQEIDRCILSYFSFHWSQATLMITQLVCPNSEGVRKLKKIVMAATREERFRRVIKDLKMKRVFSTLLEEMKAIRMNSSETSEVNVPATDRDRNPVLLLMGGGMGAGKSTVLKDILKESFWSEATRHAVVVEADAFKESDVIYKELNSRSPHDMLQTAELVHQSSLDAASSLLVTALNEGRDVIMDGTLSWIPFVEQTIAMARNVHHTRYRMGPGYKISQDGSVMENYWEQVDPQLDQNQSRKMKPYRIEMVGVVCDPCLAVVRGIRRAVLVRRAVRVNSQLKSHKRFAAAFPGYCKLVDNARLYCTNATGIQPKLIGWKERNKEMKMEPDDINFLQRISMLNEDADSMHELYRGNLYRSGSIWNDTILSPSRSSLQQELRNAIKKIDNWLDVEI